MANAAILTHSRLREREGRLARERVEQGFRTACGAPAERWPDATGHAPGKGANVTQL